MSNSLNIHVIKAIIDSDTKDFEYEYFSRSQLEFICKFVIALYRKERKKNIILNKYNK